MSDDNETDENGGNGDATLKARVLSKMDRKGKYCPKAVTVDDALPNMVGVQSHEYNDVRRLAHEMARDDAEPLQYKRLGETVCLESDSEDWVYGRIKFHDPDEAEAGQGDDLRVIR